MPAYSVWHTQFLLSSDDRSSSFLLHMVPVLLSFLLFCTMMFLLPFSSIYNESSSPSSDDRGDRKGQLGRRSWAANHSIVLVRSTSSATTRRIRLPSVRVRVSTSLAVPSVLSALQGETQNNQFHTLQMLLLPQLTFSLAAINCRILWFECLARKNCSMNSITRSWSPCPTTSPPLPSKITFSSMC